MAMEVLSLRRDQSSTVETLLASLEWQNRAKGERFLMRGHAALQAADIVLLKVAVHAAEAQRMFDEGGYVLTPPKRAVRPRRNGRCRRQRDSHATRQLYFATFYN